MPLRSTWYGINVVIPLIIGFIDDGILSLNVESVFDGIETNYNVVFVDLIII